MMKLRKFGFIGFALTSWGIGKMMKEVVAWNKSEGKYDRK
jgi:hypothetical protein